MKTARLPHAEKAAARLAPFRRQSPKPRPYTGDQSDAPPVVAANALAGSYECKRRQLACAERELRACQHGVACLRTQVAALKPDSLTI